MMSAAVAAYMETPRTEWVVSWPGQVVLATSIIYWTTEATKVLCRRFSSYSISTVSKRIVGRDKRTVENSEKRYRLLVGT